MDREALVKKYSRQITKRSIANKILFWSFFALSVVASIESTISYFVLSAFPLPVFITRLLMCMFSVFMLFLPDIVEAIFKVSIPNYLLYVFLPFIFFHFIAGEVYRLYDVSVVFDKILHTTSGFIFTFFALSFITLFHKRTPDKLKLSPLFTALFAFCFAMTTEYVWEIGEFVLDRIFGSNMQRWQDGILSWEGSNVLSEVSYGSGLKDSMMDMIVNVIGGLIAIVWMSIGMARNNNWISNKVMLRPCHVKAWAEEYADRDLQDSAEQTNENGETTTQTNEQKN